MAIGYQLLPLLKVACGCENHDTVDYASPTNPTLNAKVWTHSQNGARGGRSRACFIVDRFSGRLPSPLPNQSLIGSFHPALSPSSFNRNPILPNPVQSPSLLQTSSLQFHSHEPINSQRMIMESNDRRDVSSSCCREEFTDPRHRKTPS